MKTTISTIVFFLCVIALHAQGLVSFRDDKEWGYKDQNGKVIVKPKYKYAYDFNEGLALVKNKKEKYGFVDGTGKEIIPVKYDDARQLSEGLAAVKKDDKYGFVDKAGAEVILFKYEVANSFSEGLAAVKLNGKWGFIDQTGKEVIPCKYDDAGRFVGDLKFSEGLAALKLNDRYGFIDKTGKEIIPFTYSDVKDFSEGLAAVRLYGKYGYIDKTNEVVIEPQFEYAGEFRDGEASVKLNDKTIYIDKTGKNDEMRKKDAEAKAEIERQKELIAKQLEKKDEQASEVYKLYLQHNNTLFTKVNALNEYLKSSMQQNTKGEFSNSPLWGSMSINMKEQYCKNATQALDAYKAAMKSIVLTSGKNELYDKVNSYLNNVQNYISSCNGWAEFMKDKTNAFDAPAVKQQLDYIDKPLQAMAKDERTIRAFFEIYKKRNGL